MRKALRSFNIFVCLYLGGMFLWYADKLFNSGIPPPHDAYVWAHQAILTWMVLKLWTSS